MALWPCSPCKLQEWHTLGDFETLDRRLQALLATAVATSWFTKEQLDDLDTWRLNSSTSNSWRAEAERGGGLR